MKLGDLRRRFAPGANSVRLSSSSTLMFGDRPLIGSFNVPTYMPFGTQYDGRLIFVRHIRGSEAPITLQWRHGEPPAERHLIYAQSDGRPVAAVYLPPGMPSSFIALWEVERLLKRCHECGSEDVRPDTDDCKHFVCNQCHRVFTPP